jgi:hypothetical protein
VWSVPGQVGSLPVIGGEEHQVIGTQRGEDRADGGIEPFQVPRIARHVAAVAVKAVELDEIGEGQAALLGVFHMIGEMGHQVGIGALDIGTHPLPAKMSRILPMP